MGWIVSIALLVGAAFLIHDQSVTIDMVLIASGLFAIAGSVGAVATSVGKHEKK